MKLRVSHLTRYEYTQPVSFSPHVLYLRPRETPQLRVNHFRFNVAPNARLFSSRDAHDNSLTWVHFWDRANALNIRTEFEIETLDLNPFDFILKTQAVNCPFEYEPIERAALAPYLTRPYPDAQTRIINWLDEHFIERPVETVPYLTALNQLLFTTLAYARRDEHGIQPATTTLELGSGSCRDFAVLLMEICRTIGFAARFVSGYLYAPPDDDHRSANAMHAWTEVYLPGAGWRGLDPTHGIFCTDAFVPVAHAAMAESINPVQGSYYSPVPVPAKLTTNVLVEKLAD